MDSQSANRDAWSVAWSRSRCACQSAAKLAIPSFASCAKRLSPRPSNWTTSALWRSISSEIHAQPEHACSISHLSVVVCGTRISLSAWVHGCADLRIVGNPRSPIRFVWSFSVSRLLRSSPQGGRFIQNDRVLRIRDLAVPDARFTEPPSRVHRSPGYLCRAETAGKRPVSRQTRARRPSRYFREADHFLQARVSDADTHDARLGSDPIEVWDETVYRRVALPGDIPIKAMCVPSGDQEGWKICMGGLVSCSAVAVILPPPPQSAFREGDISHPLAVAGEVDKRELLFPHPCASFSCSPYTMQPSQRVRAQPL